jgi:hypothetical protein
MPLQGRRQLAKRHRPKVLAALTLRLFKTPGLKLRGAVGFAGRVINPEATAFLFLTAFHDFRASGEWAGLVACTAGATVDRLFQFFRHNSMRQSFRFFS